MKYCPKCESTEILRNVQLSDKTDNGTRMSKARVEANPHAIFFKGAMERALYFDACANCGYVEFRMRPIDVRDLMEHKRNNG